MKLNHLPLPPVQPPKTRYAEIFAVTERLLEIITAQQGHHVFHRKRRQRALVFRNSVRRLPETPG
jgi:hypothetical protein